MTVPCWGREAVSATELREEITGVNSLEIYIMPQLCGKHLIFWGKKSNLF